MERHVQPGLTVASTAGDAGYAVGFVGFYVVAALVAILLAATVLYLVRRPNLTYGRALRTWWVLGIGVVVIALLLVRRLL